MKSFFETAWYAFLFLFIPLNNLQPQADYIQPYSEDSYLEFRLSDLLGKKYMVDFFSMTRFLHNYSLSTLQSWTSPGTGFSIDGISFDVMPLNYNTAELLPLDQFQVQKIILVNDSGIGRKEEVSGFRYLNFKRKEITDSFTVESRGYLGSETGDPLIHTFTRPETPAVNINKIPLSGSLSVSNGTPPAKYRFTLGYFAHFSSSSVNDQVMNFRNPRFYSKLDKQVLASAELRLKLNDEREIKFNSGFMSSYGWDIPPFTGSVMHFESFLYSVNAEIENLFGRAALSLNSQGSMNEINGMTGIFPSRFFIMKNFLHSNWPVICSSKLNMILTPEISLYSAKNKTIDGVPVQKNFFKEEINKPGYSVSALAEYKFSESLTGNLNIGFEKHFSENSAFSINGRISKVFDKTEIFFSAASAPRFPTASDLYGRFQVIDYAGTDTNEYIIEGNKYLKEERLNYLGIGSKTSSANIYASAEFFFQELEKPIIQKTLAIKRTANPGDIVRDALCVNSDQKRNYCVNIFSGFKITGSLLLSCSYIFNENSESEFFPRHKIYASLQSDFSGGSSVIINWFYRSSSTAEEFIFSRENDEFLHAGFDGKIPESSSLNISFIQSVSPFYFINGLSLKVSVDNIFDRVLKFFPAGNETGRAIVFYISGRI